MEFRLTLFSAVGKTLKHQK